MKKLFLLLALLCTLAANPCAAQSRPWTTGELLGGVSVGGLLVADWMQTRHGIRQTITVFDYTPGSSGQSRQVPLYYETNPLLGRQPSQGKINLYFLIMIPAIFLAADYFQEYRTEILLGVGLAEAVTVRSNFQHNMSIKF